MQLLLPLSDYIDGLQEHLEITGLFSLYSARQLPEALAAAITPRVPNNPKSRETFTGATGINFDRLAPAKASVALTLRILLEPTRAARLARTGAPGFEAITRGLLETSW